MMRRLLNGLRGGEALHREVDGAADRGPSRKGAGCGEDRRRETARILVVMNHRPVGDDHLLACPGPFDKAHRDHAGGAAADRREDPRIGQRRGVALALQLELALVDAARHVGGEDEQEIGVLSPCACAEGQQS